MSTIYRGYDIIKLSDGMFRVKHGGTPIEDFKTEKAAVEFIDKRKRMMGALK